ncbi:MAG: hypothetical protein KatS3mg087_1602 [Patescibacteria group bacterium]|nr:MAG: hypothetical protein KatS3mg087_1602 [Patescibacteria group bacterium]
MAFNVKDRFRPRGRTEGPPNKDGARGENRRYVERRPIPGVVDGVDTLPDTSYDGKWPRLRDKRKAQSPKWEGKVVATPAIDKKKLGQGWKGQHRPLFGDPKDGQKGSSVPAQRGDWDILSGDDLL